MKFLFVTYRWGKDLVGGAEIHHRRLVFDLVRRGHEVIVWTTTTREIKPAGHWGVVHTAGYEPGLSEDEGVEVLRFPVAHTSRLLLGLACRFIQRRIEKEWREFDPAPLMETAREFCLSGDWAGMLLTGWHWPELESDGRATRWSSDQATVLLPGRGGRLSLSGFAPRPQEVEFSRRDVGGGQAVGSRKLKGWFEEEVEVPGVEEDLQVLRLRVGQPWRPWKDHRTLGLRLSSASWESKGGTEKAELDLWEDYRALGRRNSAAWWRHLEEVSERRGRVYGRLFDWVRGPRCPAMASALANPPDCDAVIAANFPWSTIPMVATFCHLPLLALPLWHLDDDFYYWKHYAGALRKAKLVLANSAYSAEEFYKPRGIEAAFVGPGVATPSPVPDSFDPVAWKTEHGIGAEEAVVLVVCRKSPEKRYELVAKAVGQLRDQDRAVRCVLIGPDVDRRPLSPHVVYLGRVEEAELEHAYRSCDMVAFLSESESFGMVVAEAWLRGKPVIVNRICGPTASLVEEGVNGLLATGVEDLAGAIGGLLDHPDLARTMGEAGRRTAERQYTQEAATDRLLQALEGLSITS